MGNCNCAEKAQKKDFEKVERVAKRLVAAKSKRTGKTEIYVIFRCKNGNADFMDAEDWEKAVSEGTEYTFVEYVSSIG
jgi:hypothetical protein